MVSKAPRVAAIVLAAGGSTRLGRPKQLVEIEGKTLIRILVAAALGSKCQRVFVVTGAYAPIIRQELRGLVIDLVDNPDWETGIGASIGAGIRAVRKAADYHGVLLMVCDQPRVTSDLLDRMIEAFRKNPEAIVVCDYSEVIGVPVLFGKVHFDRLARLPADQGAGRWLHTGNEPKIRIPFPDGVWDIDEEKDIGTLPQQADTRRPR